MINRWLQCVNQRNVEKAVSLYADDATLWGTFSETRRDGANFIREYFTHFLSLDSLQAVVKHFTTRCRNDIKVYSGEYIFHYRQDDSDKRVNARFSFVTQILNDTELILEHHSSIIPKS